MKAQKPSFKPRCAPPKPGQQPERPWAHLWGMSHQHQHLPWDPALSPTLRAFCPCGGVQTAASSSPHTRHLQAAELGRCEALEEAIGPGSLLDPAPSRRELPEHPILPLEGVAAGLGQGKELDTPFMFSMLETFLRASS